MTPTLKNNIETLKKILNYDIEPYGSSDSEKMSQLTGLKSLMGNYILPKDINFATFEEKFKKQFQWFFFSFNQFGQVESLLNFKNNIEKEEFKEFVIKQESLILKKIIKLNNLLIELNPQLKHLPRNNNFENEYHLACGVIYKRNPDDIEHFLKTRQHSKKNIEYITDKVLTKTNFFTACYCQILNHYLKEQQKPTITKRWVISSKTLINSLNELGVSVQFKNKRQNDSINQIVKHVDLLNKRPIQVRPKIWI